MPTPSPRRRPLILGALCSLLAVVIAPSPVAAAVNCATDYLPSPPANDAYANPRAFKTTTVTLNGVNCWATAEPGEAQHAGQPAAKSVWFDFDTLQGYTARIDISTAGSDFDTRLAVYDLAGNLVASNDDVVPGNRTSKVSFMRVPTGSAGHIPYRVVVDGYTDGASTADGQYVLSWKQPLVAFTSTTHLARSIVRIYRGEAAVSSDYSTAASMYDGGHNFQPGWIASTLTGSSTTDAMPIARLYTAVFDRLPDQSGLEYWIGRRRSGTSLTRMAASMTQSPEFVATYGALSNTAFVNLVYQNVLDRAPDAAGRSYWVKRLNAGYKRSSMMIGFSESPEFEESSYGLMRTSVVWRLGHGSKNDAQLRSLATDTGGDEVSLFGFLLEDPGFQSYVAGL